MNHLCGDWIEAHSAGLEPGVLNPYAVQVMGEEGIDISLNKTKSVSDFIERGDTFSYVITVCDETNGERCPVFPGVTCRIHWSFPDPATVAGTEKEQISAIRKIRDDIKDAVVKYCASLENFSHNKGNS
jgi:arsenate reductase